MYDIALLLGALLKGTRDLAMLTCSRSALQTHGGSVKNLLSTVLQCPMHWTLQVSPAAVVNGPSAAASSASSKNKLDDIPAVRFSREPTCIELASTDRQRPSQLATLINDVSLHSSMFTIPPPYSPFLLKAS